MKFGKKILTLSEASGNLCPASSWLDYKNLKKLVKTCKNEQHPQSGSDSEESQSSPSKIKDSAAETAFFKSLLSELKKVSHTYKQMENSVLQGFLLFVPEVEALKKTESPSKEQISSCLKECAEHHLKFVLLENYAVMNYCGFTKILKKHDKMTGFSTREKYMLRMVNECPFAAHRSISVATKLILKEFHLLKSLKPEKESSSMSKEPVDSEIPSSGAKEKISKESKIEIENTVKRGLSVKKLSTVTLSDEGFSPEESKRRSSSQEEELGSDGPGNRLNDLVSLLEKHQKELASPDSKRKRSSENSEESTPKLLKK